MKKQLSFTKTEQNKIKRALKAISEVLLHKMDKAVESPQLEGSFYVENENRVVEFLFHAKQTTPIHEII